MKTPQESTTSLGEKPEIHPKNQSKIQFKIQPEIQLKNQPPSLPLISIIIPIHNAAKFLNQTISSCLKQDYPNLEIILINDGSTDDSKTICEKYLKASTSVLFFDRPHQGVSATRNFGLDHFSGEYFSFLDADDLLAENFISTLYTLAKENNLDYITSGYQRFVGNFPKAEPRKPECAKSIGEEPQKQKSTKSIRETLRIYDKSSFYKQLLDLNSGYNFCHMKLIKKPLRHVRFDESLSVAEDALYNFKILNELSSFGATSAPLYFYRVHKNSTVRTFSEDYIEKYRKSLQKIGNFLQENQGDLYQKYQKYFYAFKSLYQIPLFARAIYLTPLRLFPPQKALVLFCFKFKLIFFLSLIGHLRAKQNSK